MNGNRPLVKIVTSAFNGEKYIREQVNSVLKQTYPNIELYIRDNCSTDKTLNLLQEYVSNPRIHIIKGDKNLGIVGGYFTVLRLCGTADYYAYCDCDDVWPEKKIEEAITMLEQERNDIPVLYCSRTSFCDENLNFMHLGPIYHPSFSRCLLESISSGSSYVLNAKAREIIIQNVPKHAIYQDHWTYMVCQGLGKVIFDPRPLMMYRRHGENVTVSSADRYKLMLWRIKHFLMNGEIKGIRDQIAEFSVLYADQLSTKDRKTLNLFTKRSIVAALKKVFWPQRFRRTLSDEVLLRVLFLAGIL